MIKYVELTAPEASAFRQAKILSVECKEGGRVKKGDTLFMVKSGTSEIALPSTRDGRVVEIIASAQENITLSTALLLLETEVAESTATKPVADSTIVIDKAQEIEKPVSKSKPVKKSTKANKKAKRKTKKQAAPKKHEQQSLDLLGLQTETSEEVIDHEVVLDQVVEPGQVEPSQVEPGQASDASPKSATASEMNMRVSPPEPTERELPVSPIMSASSTVQITVPDIGADSAKVIEILVNVGDSVALEDPLVTLESDKASMDVPSTHDGIVKSISVELEQDVSEGVLILELEASDADQTSPAEEAETNTKASEAAPEPEAIPTLSTRIVDVTIPDIGGDSAKVIEILVEAGQVVGIEDPLVTLESDKASMDVPSSHAGVVESIELSIDQDVSEGMIVVKLKTEAGEPAAVETKAPPAPSTKTTAEITSAPQAPASTSSVQQGAPAKPAGKSHASPSVRRFARELGVDLGQVTGTGRKGRVSKDDVKLFVKGAMTTSSTVPSPAGGSGIPPIPAQDFSKFGDIEVQPLNKIKRLTATNLHRSWVNVPHVTHNDESNISDLESFRKQLNSEYAKQGKDTKLSPLAFIVKAVVNAMQMYPQFNSSLEPGGKNLILKKYFHIGIAVDTPNGLVVPVVRDADKKSVAEIGREMNELAAKARDKKLTMNDMSGACFTISSLGGIGGTGFTPIVNAPEVAILGVSRSKMKPVWNGSDFEPGMLLPLSLSYDHRVIDGAEAARFTRHIAAVLEDVRRLTV